MCQNRTQGCVFQDPWQPRLCQFAVAVALLSYCVLFGGVGVAEEARSSLGIGFLWTAQSQAVVGRLKSDKDFVDLILSSGRVDVFEKVKPPVRVACIARSLEGDPSRPFPGIKQTVEILRSHGIAPDRVIIAYNPENQPGTPPAELSDLVSSVRQAREIARAFGAPLLVGPGLREMSHRETLYPELARSCDMWLIQSQRLQLDEESRNPVPVEVYREKVKHIVELLRQGNPAIKIYVQVITTAGRDRSTLSADQVVAFARSIEDMVDGVRIYGASENLLNEVMEKLRGPVEEFHNQ